MLAWAGAEAITFEMLKFDCLPIRWGIAIYLLYPSL